MKVFSLMIIGVLLLSSSTTNESSALNSHQEKIVSFDSPGDFHYIFEFPMLNLTTQWINTKNLTYIRWFLLVNLTQLSYTGNLKIFFIYLINETENPSYPNRSNFYYSWEKLNGKSSEFLDLAGFYHDLHRSPSKNNGDELQKIKIKFHIEGTGSSTVNISINYVESRGWVPIVEPKLSIKTTQKNPLPLTGLEILPLVMILVSIKRKYFNRRARVLSFK